MSIQKELDKINNATYGREVRGAIHDGIKKAYDDASEKDNANMEVKIARGTNPNLNTRLNKMDATDSQNTKKIDSNHQEVTAQLAKTATYADRFENLEQAFQSAIINNSDCVVLSGGKTYTISTNVHKKINFIPIKGNNATLVLDGNIQLVNVSKRFDIQDLTIQSNFSKGVGASSSANDIPIVDDLSSAKPCILKNINFIGVVGANERIPNFVRTPKMNSGTIENIKSTNVASVIYVVPRSENFEIKNVNGYNCETLIAIYDGCRDFSIDNVSMVNTKEQQYYWIGMNAGTGRNGKDVLLIDSKAVGVKNYKVSNISGTYTIECVLYNQGSDCIISNIKAYNTDIGKTCGYTRVENNISISNLTCVIDDIDNALSMKGFYFGFYNVSNVVVDGLHYNASVPTERGAFLGFDATVRDVDVKNVNVKGVNTCFSLVRFYGYIATLSINNIKISKVKADNLLEVNSDNLIAVGGMSTEKSITNLTIEDVAITGISSVKYLISNSKAFDNVSLSNITYPSGSSYGTQDVSPFIDTFYAESKFTSGNVERKYSFIYNYAKDSTLPKGKTHHTITNITDFYNADLVYETSNKLKTAKFVDTIDTLKLSLKAVPTNAEFHLPINLESGIYAMKLYAGNGYAEAVLNNGVTEVINIGGVFSLGADDTQKIALTADKTTFTYGTSLKLRHRLASVVDLVIEIERKS